MAAGMVIGDGWHGNKWSTGMVISDRWHCSQWSAGMVIGSRCMVISFRGMVINDR